MGQAAPHVTSCGGRCLFFSLWTVSAPCAGGACGAARHFSCARVLRCGDVGWWLNEGSRAGSWEPGGRPLRWPMWWPDSRSFLGASLAGVRGRRQPRTAGVRVFPGTPGGGVSFWCCCTTCFSRRIATLHLRMPLRAGHAQKRDTSTTCSFAVVLSLSQERGRGRPVRKRVGMDCHPVNSDGCQGPVVRVDRDGFNGGERVIPVNNPAVPR